MLLTNLEILQTELSGMPITYIIHVHLNNLIECMSRVEVEAAIVLYCAGRKSKNSTLNLHIRNIENTYGPAALMDSASLMGLCTLDKVS